MTLRSPWAAILTDIVLERGRQEQLRAEGRCRHTAASRAATDFARFIMLAKPYGDVGESVASGGPEIRPALVRLGAVCVAWLEAIDEAEAKAAVRSHLRADADVRRDENLTSPSTPRGYADPEPPQPAPAEEVGARGDHEEAQDREAHEEEVAPPGRHGEVGP